MNIASGFLANTRAASRLCVLRNARGVSSSATALRQRRRTTTRGNHHFSLSVVVPNATMSHSDNSGTGEMVSLIELVSTCVDAAQRGCAEIRAVQERRASSGGQLASTRKDVDDPRSALTEADTKAQIAIVRALRATWPGLRIVGEEEEEEEEENNEGDGIDGEREIILRRDMCVLDMNSDTNASSIAEWKEPLDVLTVFVDPVDGTREFVEGRLEAVQCLIGVACRGRSVAGAIGLPFSEGTLEASPTTSVVWGVAQPGALRGIKGTAGAASATTKSNQRLSPSTEGCVCVTGDSKNESLAAARAAVAAAAEVMIGGAGNKILAVAEGRADVAIMHFGTSLWDTCAPEAVLRASGGKVTDLFGSPLIHSPNRPGGSLLNDLGVLATTANLAAVDADGRDHAALAEAMRGNEGLRATLLTSPSRMGDAMGAASAHEPQAVDIARCLDGSPLSTSWVGQRVATTLCGGEDVPFKLKGYTAPESSAIRGLMSDACRLELIWEEKDLEAVGMPSTCFYKRVAMGDLEYARTKAVTQPLKINRDVQSAAVEAAFLACSPVTAALAAAGVKVPRCFDADLRPW